VFLGRDIKSQWSLLSGARGKCVTCSGLTNSRRQLQKTNDNNGQQADWGLMEEEGALGLEVEPGVYFTCPSKLGKFNLGIHKLDIYFDKWLRQTLRHRLNLADYDYGCEELQSPSVLLVLLVIY